MSPLSRKNGDFRWRVQGLAVCRRGTDPSHSFLKEPATCWVNWSEFYFKWNSVRLCPPFVSAYRGESVDQRYISVGGRCSFLSGLGPMYFSLKSSLRKGWKVLFSLIEVIVRFLFIYTKGRFCLFIFQKKSFSFGAMEVNWSRPSAYRWRKEILKFGLIDTCTGFSFWIRSASYWQGFALPLFSPKL